MNFYNEIKKELIDNEIYKKVKDYSKNKYELQKYYNVGKLLYDAGKHYGEGIIKEYSKRLTIEFGKNYSIRLLYRMLKFYRFVSAEKMPTLSAKLSWSHYDEILRFDDINKINYYIKIIEEQSLSIRKLREKIKSKEYERLPEETKNKLISNEKADIEDFVKEPINIRNRNNYEEVSEKLLQKMILEDIESFMKELGNSYSFIGSEYPIKLGNRYNYIDLLLFNYEYNCFVVVELKVTELRKEHIGQIQIYMNYIDENIRKINQDKTIGIIIVRENNKYIIKYASDRRILSRTYELV